MFKITYSLVRFPKASNAVVSPGYFGFNKLSSVPITATIRNIDAEVNPEVNTEPRNTSTKSEQPLAVPRSYNTLVAAAFASLKSENILNNIKTPFTDSRIENASSVGELLSISEGSGVSRRHAMKVVSVLEEWSTCGKVDLSEFESDPRFIRLCKILAKGSPTFKSKPIPQLRNEDLSTIMNIAADDEAAKLIASISFPQMVKVMAALAHKKRRSTPLLRSLAYNITSNKVVLDLKQSADLLYSMSVLSFIDENLLQKICTDVCASLPGNLRSSAVVGSIITSLGHLRYKDKEILNALSNWIVTNKECRSQDVFALFVTSAILNHTPDNYEDIYKIFIPQLKIEIKKPNAWLDIVWSLVLLNRATSEHVSSVLSDSFLKNIEADSNATLVSKLKLLNIHSYCELLMENYDGPKLATDSNVRQAIAMRSKSKELMVTSVQDTLSNLVSPNTHLKKNINTMMGFYIDAQFAVDKRCNPIPLNLQGDSDCIMVAVMTHDYCDMCRGRAEPTGITLLFTRLLEARGYRVLTVPYTEFSSRDKLANRVKYLQTRLQNLVQ